MDNDEDREALVEDEKLNKKANKSDLANVSFNFINSIIGSGIIGMPYAIKRSGLGLGIILICVVAILSDHSLVLLVKGGQMSATSNYQDLVLKTFGKLGFYLLSLMQFVYPFIALISYNVIIGDMVTKVFKRMLQIEETNVLANRFFIIFLASALITIPLSLSRNIGKLAKISLASLCCVFFLLIVIISRAVTISKLIPDTPNAWAFAKDGILEAIGIMVFAFMCHHNSFLLYDSLDNPTQTRWNAVTHISVIISALATLIFGIIGYVIFTGYTEGDVLENFCQDDDLINVTRFIYTITIMMTFPIECFVCREVIERIFFHNQEYSTKRHFWITILIVLIALLISYATDCLGIVLGINGVVTATPLAFILPAACYLKLSYKIQSLNRNDNIQFEQQSDSRTPITQQDQSSAEKEHQPNAIHEKAFTSKDCRRDLWRKVFSDESAAWFTLVFGVVVFVVGSISIIIHLTKGISCSHGQELFYCKKLPISKSK